MNECHNVDQHIGGRIRLRRDFLQLSDWELADRLAIDTSDLRAYERGDRRISTPLLLELAVALEVRISYFFGEGHADGYKPDSSRGPDPEHRAGPTEVSRLLSAFDDISSLDDRRMLVELAEALMRGQIN